MLGIFGAPLTEKFLVRRLSANLRMLMRNGRAPGISEATCRTAAISADHAGVCASAGAAAIRPAKMANANESARATIWISRWVARTRIEHNPRARKSGSEFEGWVVP